MIHSISADDSMQNVRSVDPSNSHMIFKRQMCQHFFELQKRIAEERTNLVKLQAEVINKQLLLKEEVESLEQLGQIINSFSDNDSIDDFTQRCSNLLENSILKTPTIDLSFLSEEYHQLCPSIYIPQMHNYANDTTNDTTNDTPNDSRTYFKNRPYYQKECKHWQSKGKCSYGEKCTFRHTPLDQKM